MSRILALICLCAVSVFLAQAGPISLTTLPSSGTVAGSPGTAAGLGFSVTNTTSEWLVLNDSFFTGGTVNGTYVDYLTLPGAPVYVIGPAPESTVVSQAWNPSSTPKLGLGEFDINPTASGPITGQIGVDYSLFSQDPNAPNFDPGSFVSSGVLSATVQVDVVPEPASIVMLSGGLAPIALLVWRRRKARRARLVADAFGK